MPRPPRLHVPGGYYHVMLRGNHREALFETPNDRYALNEIVIDVLQRFNSRLHAYCWMTNHIHALVQIGDQPLGKLMQRIAMRFSRFRHRALRTTGHLFDKRHKPLLVDVDEYFLTLLRYIHLNPVAAGMVDDPADYPYSSHRAYLGTAPVPWVTTEFGLSLFSRDLTRARREYQRFVSYGVGEELESEVHPEDPRVLGTDDFISKIPRTLYKPRSAFTLEQLAEQICTEHSIDVDLLRSPLSIHRLTPIRLQLLRAATDQRVATLTQVALFLHRDPSTLCKLLRVHQQKVQK